ncbi:amidohydrolase family protein [Sorangium sp. So ce1335]|uniref:amidohydrolase family protein n=1 Tax=Sorangium sp. So ce1335 TaxID=3133335 RepID=UPI003F61CECB
MKKSLPDDGLRLPVKLDSTSNGEYWPRPPDPALREVQRSAMESALENARKLGMSRREYLASTCGAATVFLALNQLGCSGGRYQVTRESTVDPGAADEVLTGKEFIFDVQTHQVSAERVWWKEGQPSLADFLKTTPQAECGAPSWARCFTDDVLIREVFMNSDTQLAVLSGLWGDPLPILTEEAARTREKVAQLGRDRLRIHGVVQPTAAPWEKIADDMRRQAETLQLSAWKLYTVWGPTGEGWWLDDEVGRRTIEHGLAVGVPIFAVHKGLPLSGMNPAYTRPKDVGPAARAFPKATFLIYHSGYEPDVTEGPYDPKATRGVDALIRSLEENGIGQNGNVYAELGSTWREVMKSPDEAAHVVGKLLKHLGEDRILWGTDAIWFGSPQDQIQAFRAFEITPEFQERYGYPALTPERKAKIFGLNAARVYGVNVAEARKAHLVDDVSRARAEYANAGAPSFQTYGPRTRRDMLRLLDFTRGMPD